MDSDFVGHSLRTLGALIALLDAGILFFSRIPLLGRLPGNISFQRDGFSFFFPVVTCLVLSLILAVAVNIAIQIFR
jgi:hypothetical protein